MRAGLVSVLPCSSSWRRGPRRHWPRRPGRSSPSENGDYFGFDLRSEQNVTLDQCKTTCLGDQQCRAFTYNTRAKWCFLKSDFATMKTFNGAVAGKVVSHQTANPTSARRLQLAFFPAWMADEAASTRTALTSGAVAIGDAGLVGLTEAGRAGACSTGDPRTAVQRYTAAVATAPDDGSALAEAWRARCLPFRASTARRPPRCNATPPRPPGMPISFCAPLPRAPMCLPSSPRASTAATSSARRCRPIEASLALVNSASVRAEYEDLKARKGFRVVEHTVEADTPSPRICAQFSEELVKAGVDYAPFVTVDEAPRRKRRGQGQARSASRGWSMAATTRVAFRPGLPSAIGEVLAGAGRAVDLHPGSRRLGPLHRRQLRPARDRAARHPGRHRQHGRGRHEALPHRRPLAGAASFRLPVPAPARRLRHRQPSPISWARPSGKASWPSPTSSTRKSPPASRSTRRCPTASPASMC